MVTGWSLLRIRISLAWVALAAAACAPAPTEPGSLRTTFADCGELLFSGKLAVRLSAAIAGAPASIEVLGAPEHLATLQLTTDPHLAVSAPAERLVAHVSCPADAPAGRVRTLGEVVLEADAGATPVRVGAYGFTRVTLTGYIAELHVSTSGDAEVALRQMDVDTLHVAAAGRSTVRAAGRANRLQIDALGQARVESYALDAQTVVARAGGASQVEVSPSAHLHMTVAQGAAVTYRGNPEIAQTEPDAMSE